VLVVGPPDSYGTRVAGVSEGLQAGGFSDASQVRVDVRARAPDEARAIVAAAVHEGVDAIVAVFGQATHTAHQLAPSTPVVFCPVADPVASKLVASLLEPVGLSPGSPAPTPRPRGGGSWASSRSCRASSAWPSSSIPYTDGLGHLATIRDEAEGLRATRRRALFIIDTGPVMVLAVLGAVWGDARRWRRRRRA